jgi:hypothetical protein
MSKQTTQRKPAIQYREDRPSKGDRKIATQHQRTADQRLLRRELQNWDRPDPDLDEVDIAQEDAEDEFYA